jgi:hypothetical protein
MGCLNDDPNHPFPHFFGNIHLSGPCNRSCYFCIGQHMMALDQLNNLTKIPENIDQFLRECMDRNVAEICMTGTNTDPLLYARTPELVHHIRRALPGTPLAIRTNGIAYDRKTFDAYDKASVTICSFDKEINEKMMGGAPCDLPKILENHPMMDIKVNVILGPENMERDSNGSRDIFGTLDMCSCLGVKRVNLREPYGQPHIGDPLEKSGALFLRKTLGMPTYSWGFTEATYWDVHFVEVESVNLYANGRISLIYPITKGHDPSGVVLPQAFFPGGRIHEQWL